MTGVFFWGKKQNKTLLAFVLLHFVLQGQICLLLQVLLDLLILLSRSL